MYRAASSRGRTDEACNFREINNLHSAIPAHQASYEFFTRHAWIDRYRAITMMSPSAMSYREMALCNVAFAYTQIGEGAKAKEYYLRVLQEFPESALARAALKMIESAERASQDRTPA